MPNIDSYVYIAIGCNLGVKKSLTLWAIRQIKLFSTVCEISPFYYNRATLNINTPRYLNSVVKIKTRLSPIEVLSKLQLIERRCGRPFHRVKNYSRRCDLDIIYFNNEIINSSKLVVPHPYRLERDFVLLPMSFISPNFQDPISKKELLHEAKHLSIRSHNLNSFYSYAPFVNPLMFKHSKIN